MNKFDINDFRQIHKHCHIKSNDKQTNKNEHTKLRQINRKTRKSNEDPNVDIEVVQVIE